MPMRFVKEMFCDRVAASKIYKGKDYTDASAWEYYAPNKDRLPMHPNTAALLEEWLLTLRDEGEEKAFALVKKAVIENKKQVKNKG